MGTTTNYGLPYPEGTDFVIAGDDAMQALAEAVDDRLYTGSTVAQIEPAESPSSTGADVDFNGTQTVMNGFSYSTGLLTYLGPARTFMIAAEVEILNGGATTAEQVATLFVSGVGVAGSTDRIDSASTVTERRHTHRLVIPRTLSYGDTVKVSTTATPAGSIGVASLSVYPIGPATS
jgi:hypothetical protein